MKISLILGILALPFASLAAEQDAVLIQIDDTESYAYADGSPALSGEWCAIVWLADGCDFAGFNADSSVIDADNSALVYSEKMINENHAITQQNLVVDRDLWGNRSGGSFLLLLLDTRAYSPVDGKGSVAAALDRSHPALHGYAELSRAPVADTDRVKITAVFRDSELNWNVPTPVFTTFEVGDDGVITLAATGTAVDVNYNIVCGSKLDNISLEGVADLPVSGNGGEIKLHVTLSKLKEKVDVSSCFFRITRNSVKTLIEE